jgi:hypothetical protein
MSSGYPAAVNSLLQVRGSLRLRDDIIAVARMHRHISIAMKYNGGDNHTWSRAEVTSDSEESGHAPSCMATRRGEIVTPDATTGKTSMA